MSETKKSSSNFKPIDIAFIAVCAALMAVCAWLEIPAVVPFTLQTFAIFFALDFLGGKKGTIAITVYILLGAVGVPVFSKFQGGIGALLGTTGGYIIGFIFSGLIYWLFETVLPKKYFIRVIAMILGLFVCYAFGTAWFMIVYAKTHDAIGLQTALVWCVYKFIPFDLAKIALALGLGKVLRKALNIGR